jgi:hypothetical protein
MIWDSDRVAARASSKTYTKVNKKIATAIGKRAPHTGRPSVDFELILGESPAHSKKRALRYYERGLQRGLIEAGKAILDGRIKIRNGKIRCRSRKLVIAREFRFSNGTRAGRKFRFDPEALF